MFMFKQTYTVRLEQIPKCDWHKLDRSKIKLTEDLDLLYITAEVLS